MTHNTIPRKSSVKKAEAKIAVGKNLRKSKDGIVYLNDGTDFQIMLHNPFTQNILARIYVNEEAIGQGGIIIRPGERIWLDRWLDEQRKLTFSTYKVSDTQGSKEAVAENGKVRVEFFNKQVDWEYPNNSGNPIWINPPVFGGTGNPTYTYFNNTTIGSDDLIGTLNSSSDVTLTNSLENASFTSNLSVDDLKASYDIAKDTKVETGKVEKGEKSDQEFNTVDENYNSFSFQTEEYTILPSSRKNRDFSELKTYCTGCGLKRRNENWKFCPSCGTEL